MGARMVMWDSAIKGLGIGPPIGASKAPFQAWVTLSPKVALTCSPASWTHGLVCACASRTSCHLSCLYDQRNNDARARAWSKPSKLIGFWATRIGSLIAEFSRFKFEPSSQVSPWQASKGCEDSGDTLDPVNGMSFLVASGGW